MANIPVANLQPGDLLLCMGTGEISKLIAWVGANDYSHCAIVCDGSRLIEAAASGARYVDLVHEQSLSDEYVYIDAVRNHHQSAAPLAGANLDAFLGEVRAYVGRPYDLDRLVELGVAIAVRNKVPQHPLGRLLFRLAIDHLMSSDPKAVVCSELAYRLYTEGPYAPPDVLKPEIVITPPIDLPFPQIDWIALWKEYEAARRSTPKLASASVAMQATPPEPAELAARIAEARRHLGLDAPLADGAPTDGGEIVDPRVNPKTVIPSDFAASPSYFALGRFVGA